MMTPNDANQLTLACQAYGVEIPPAVLDARATVKAAEDNLAAIKAETGPGTAGPDSVGQVFDATMTQLTKAGREKVANDLLNSVKGQEEDAWRNRTATLMEAFREPFDDAVARFTAAAHALDGCTGTDHRVNAESAINLGLAVEYQAYMKAAADMKQLAKVRDILCPTDPEVGISGEYGRITRYAHVPNRTTAMRLPSRIGSETYEPHWWRALLDTDGVTVQWNGPQEQRDIRALSRA